MRKTNKTTRKSMKLDTQTVRTLSSDTLTSVAAAGGCTAGWSCCGDCTNSGFISCIEL